MSLFGSTSGTTSLTWQLRAVNEGATPVVIFETTATSVGFTDDGTTVADQFDACVTKNSGAAQDFDISLVTSQLLPP